MKTDVKTPGQNAAEPGTASSLSPQEYELAEVTTLTTVADSLPAAEKAGPIEGSLERRIAQGVKGSFLVSVATLPFGYLLSLVLARVSPEAVGTYSVLGIYLGVVSTLLYFGGGTVTIRFMAELPREKRMPFFLSYFVLTLGVAGLALLGSFAFPGIGQLIFGSKVRLEFFRLLLLLSPVPLFFFASLAALRGIMQITLAQALMRAVTLVSCLLYAYLLVFKTAFFQREYAKMIVASYFLLMLFMALVGFRTLWKELGAPGHASWFLPAGFWSFALAVQVPSMLALMQLKIDEIFLLWALGLSLLGIYFVLSQLAGAAELLSNFFLEGVFPAVLNLQAAGKSDKTVELHAKAAKFVLLISSSTVLFLIAFADPLLRFLGGKYRQGYASFMVLLCFASLDSLGPVNHTLIVGLKKMKSWTLVQSVRLVGFLLLFGLLSRHYGLLGVVLARGFAWMLAGAIGYWIVLNQLPIKVRIPRQYFLYVALSLGSVVLCYSTREVISGWLWSGVLFCVSFGAFLALGGYRPSELHHLRALWPWARSGVALTKGEASSADDD